jgi:hypothetical protein
MMSLPYIIVSSVKVRHFDGTNFVSWKSPMPSYLYEMNPQVWWMVYVAFSHALEDCPQTQVKEKCLYLKAHASNALSSALSAQVEDMIEIEYGFLESANLLWKAHEQMFGSTNDKRSSSNTLENTSSSFTHII